MAIHAHFWQAILTQKVGQTDLVLVREKSSLEGLRMQDYKSLCAVATICHPGLHPDTQTGEQTDGILTNLHDQLSQLS